VKFLETDKFLVKRLVIAFDLATTPRVVRPAEDQFDPVFLCFSFENIGYKLFSIIEIDFMRNPSGAECLAKSIDC
jgi:hypothetical protein